MKTCSICKKEKTLSEFSPHKDGKLGVQARCKECSIIYMKTWIENNPKKFRSGTISRRYGISEEEYEELLARQEGQCAICKNTSCMVHEKLSIDHDHETGLVRGLLCHNCNILLGMAKDNIVILNSAIEYLSVNML